MDQVITDRYAIYNGDCVEILSGLPDQSMDLSIYSPPFAGLYHYSSDERDVSNCTSYAQFYKHYGWIVRDLLRVTKPGRCSAVHVTDIPMGNTGVDSFHDLPGETVRLHVECGWKFVARHCVWKEPLAFRNRTLTKNLAHMTIVEDSTLAGVASADQVLIFRAPGENKIPVSHPTGLHDYAGEGPVPSELHRFKGFVGDQKQNRYSHWIWRQYASSVWDDIRPDHVLPFRDAKDPEDEKHVHPLQLDIIARVVELRSNPGETVFTPFMGVGSEVYESVRLGRRGVGAELKPSYFRQAKENLRLLGTEQSAPAKPQLDLFSK